MTYAQAQAAVLVEFIHIVHAAGGGICRIPPRFIGFRVATPLLRAGVSATYGLELHELFADQDPPCTIDTRAVRSSALTKAACATSKTDRQADSHIERALTLVVPTGRPIERARTRISEAGMLPASWE